MAFGWQAMRNDAGSVIVDQTYKNMSLVASGSVVCSSKLNGYDAAYYATFTVSNLTNPMVALRSPSTPAAVFVRNRSGTTYTFTVYVDQISLPGGAANNANTVPIYWYVFDNTPATYSGSETMGIRICNAAGQPTYDTRFRYANVVGFYNVTGSPYPSNTFSSGRQYAVVMCAPYVNSTVTRGGATAYLSFLTCGHMVSGATVAGYSVRYYTFGSSITPYTYTHAGSYMVLDVTNM